MWREICRQRGYPLSLCAVQSFGITDPRPYGFDSAVSFTSYQTCIDPKFMPGVNHDFRGYLYLAIVRQWLVAYSYALQMHYTRLG